jgi:hypothetical protein
VARGRTKAKFPKAPYFRAPDSWLSIDPASGSKPSFAVRWEGSEAKNFVAITHQSMDDIFRVLKGSDLVVVEGGGFVGANAAAALALARVRERFACVAWHQGTSTLEVAPDHWRSTLELAARPRSQAVAAQRSLCKLLADSSEPILPLAAQATNDDKRAALLIGWACCHAWNWTQDY